MSTEGGMFDEALVIFFEEAREMVQQIEDSLLRLEETPGDTETINALFRAAHTVKGSAGIFSLDRVVHFTHEVESVLDRVRTGKVEMDPTLSELMFKSCDMMGELLAQAEAHTEDPDTLAQLDTQASVIARHLSRYLQEGTDAATVAAPVAATARPENGANGVWHVSLRFGIDTFRNGFDPLTIVHYLKSVGNITAIAMVDDARPGWADFDAESCYLGFEIRLQTAATRDEIDAAFEFVRDDCIIRLIAPTRRASDFIALMDELPHEARLGDILVECGAVSRAALDAALVTQHDAAAISGAGTPTLGEILVVQNKVAPDVVEAALGKQAKSREVRSDDTRFVRVPADKLDELINLVGELVICGAGAAVMAQALRHAPMIETIAQMSGLVEEIRNGSLGLRMVQIGELFSRYRRVVRDTAAELKKEIVLEIEGSDTELDKAVVEKISDPLMHLVRNAMDHGIEMPEKRLAAGKPSAGTVRLTARHDSGNIVICVSDDGHGLDGDKLEQKARAKGLIAAGQVLSQNDRLQLIFEPGLSTAEAVTNLSGRGVGMDVVRKNIEALRGSIHLDSVQGRGTTIEIRLPLTLAIIDGFLVRVGLSSYVIPLHAVVECIDAVPENLHGNGGWAGHMTLRGEILPFIELRNVFEMADAPSARRSVVVVRQGNTLAGFVVDRLLGEYQTVIKPLGKLFRHLRGISGSTVMGSGEVALILDVPALVKLAVEHEDVALHAAVTVQAKTAVVVEKIA